MDICGAGQVEGMIECFDEVMKVIDEGSYGNRRQNEVMLQVSMTGGW